MIVLGTQQSPIRLNHCEAVPYALHQLDFRGYRNQPIPGTFKKHDFEFDAHFDTLLVGGEDWELRKIHLHTPAEHLIHREGTRAHEVHLVHARPCDKHLEGDKLVVAVFIEISDHAHPKETLWQLNVELSKAVRGAEINHSLNPREFLPDDTSQWYLYQGSLTSWPYSEDVTWYVMNVKDKVPPGAYEFLAGHAEQHPRPEQPLNRRYVLRSF